MPTPMLRNPAVARMSAISSALAGVVLVGYFYTLYSQDSEPQTRVEIRDKAPATQTPSKPQ